MVSDIMLDLETFGTNPNAVIVQIGACYFDRVTGEIGEKFLKNIDAVESVKLGFKMDPETICWWLSQSPEAIKSIIDITKFKWHPSIAIEAFNDFVKPDSNIWSHATFDMVILMEHYRIIGIKPKFDYRNSRDLRTIVALAGIDVDSYEKIGIAHNALDDCLFQVKYAVDCLRKLL